MFKLKKKESGFHSIEKFGEQHGLCIKFIISKESGYDFAKACHEGFSTLIQHCHQHSLYDKIAKCISIAPDCPDVKDCRYFPAVIFNNDKVSLDDLKQVETEKIKIRTFPNVDWYIYEHAGPYDTLGQSWKNAMDDITNKNLTLSESENFHEWYVNDSTVVPKEELITKICLPLENKAENQ